MKKYYNIDFLRIFFAITIVVFHILHSNIIPFAGEQSSYVQLAALSGWAGTAVEAFLVISGFFLYKSYNKNPNKPFIEFAVEKFVRLWPVFAAYNIIYALVYRLSIQDFILDMCMLRSTGISLSYTGIIWYISPFFWSTLLVFAILKCFNRNISVLLMSLIAYFGYAINLNLNSGNLTIREIQLGFLSGGMLRVASGICIGCLAAAALEAFEKVYGQPQKTGKLTSAIFTIAEIGCFGLLTILYFYKKIPVNNAFVMVILSVVLLICMVKGHGLLAKILNRPVFAKLGRYSYSIYVMQQLSFYLLGKTLWKNTQFINSNVAVTLLLSCAVCVLAGVAAYHLIEAPAAALYKNWKSKAVSAAE